jgi:hypothetical protein
VKEGPVPDTLALKNNRMFALFSQLRDPALKSLWRKNALGAVPERGEPGPQLLQHRDDVLTEVHRVLAALKKAKSVIMYQLAISKLSAF